MDYEHVIERAESSVSLIDSRDREAAHRVLTIVRELMGRDQQTPPGDRNDAPWRRELNRHFELLGRRGARALPVAALARAALADLGGSRRDFDEAIRDCDQKLLMFGL